MNRYVYPGIFTPEEDGGFSVRFPDLVGCYTCGDNLADTLFMASDALALMLYEYEHENREIPIPSSPNSLVLEKGEFVNLVSADTLAYRKRYNNKAIKKTLTIPEWLNEQAVSMNINFSQVLQEALLEKIQV